MQAIELAINAARRLSRRVSELTFAEPVTHVYNPLDYARHAHEAYLRMLNPAGVRVLFLGMNPGPWGMAQTGVPFGEVAAVTGWLGVTPDTLAEPVGRPADEHPKRPVEGLACGRSEVSGRRLWGLFAERFASADAFFAEHFVANYCPLVFMEAGGKNRTPDKLSPDERGPLDAACDAHLVELLAATRPEWAVGVGKYAERCLLRVVPTVAGAGDGNTRVTSVLHPSPASPAANRGWPEAATRQLVEAGVWPA
ncbi:MAG: uracil-DNA glycosylase family protein [Planctomycetota bacterium]